MLPVALTCGSTTIVYVPAVGNVTVTVPPAVPKVRGATSVDVSGFTIETLVLEIVTAESFRLTAWPAFPLKVSTAFWPGTVVLTITGAPPTLIVDEVSGGTSYRARVSEPAFAPIGSTTSA
jgi:hypothetical protein